MFGSRICLVWGHAVIFAWSDLISDRSRKLVGLQSPAACTTRAGGDSDPNFVNCGLFHAQAPDTERGVHARSWRANRDVDVKRFYTPEATNTGRGFNRGSGGGVRGCGFEERVGAYARIEGGHFL